MKYSFKSKHVMPVSKEVSYVVWVGRKNIGMVTRKVGRGWVATTTNGVWLNNGEQFVTRNEAAASIPTAQL